MIFINKQTICFSNCHFQYSLLFFMFITIFSPYGDYILLSWHNQAISSRRKNACMISMWHCSNLWDVFFFFCCIRSKDAAKALTTTFFLRGLCGSAFLTFFMAFPRYCLDMSETFTIIGLCAKEWFFSFFFSLLLSRQRAVASLSFALNVVWLCLLSEAFTLWSSFFWYSSKFRLFCLSLHSLCHWAFYFPRIRIESKFYQCLIFGS